MCYFSLCILMFTRRCKALYPLDQGLYDGSKAARLVMRVSWTVIGPLFLSAGRMALRNPTFLGGYHKFFVLSSQLESSPLAHSHILPYLYFWPLADPFWTPLHSFLSLAKLKCVDVQVSGPPLAFTNEHIVSRYDDSGRCIVQKRSAVAATGGQRNEFLFPVCGWGKSTCTKWLAGFSSTSQYW
jgi:hypothetical protein